MQVKLDVIIPAAVLARGTRAFPAAKRLEAWPGARSRALRTVGVSDARFEEEVFVTFCVVALPLDFTGAGLTNV